MANVKFYKRLPHIFVLALIVSEILTLKMFDIDRQKDTNTHTHTQMDKTMAIGEIADLPKNRPPSCGLCRIQLLQVKSHSDLFLFKLIILYFTVF